MKVVQINGSYTLSNSTGRSTAEMHASFLKAGISSWVFAAQIDREISEQRNVVQLKFEWERKVHAVMSRLTGLQGYYSFLSTAQLIKDLRRIKPDVVILRVLHNNSINFPMLTKYLSENNIVVVLVLHDCWYFTGHCCYYSQIGCEKWKSRCGDCAERKNWNKSLFFDISKRCLQDKKRWFSRIQNLGVVGVSDWVTNEAYHSILKDAKKIQRIYNWIDMQTFCPMSKEKVRAELKIDLDQNVVLGVASGWSERKGLNEMSEIARQRSDLQVILIGETPQDMPSLKNLICLGTIKDPKVLAKYYAAADVFANPSIQETFGKTTAEAMCCGTPVVAYRTTACTELVEGHKCGIAVPLRDTAAFLYAVEKLLADGKNTYFGNCIRFSKKNFDKDTNILSYLALIQHLKN